MMPAGDAERITRRQSVATRILLAFGLVILLFGAAVGIGLARLAQFNESVRSVTTTGLAKLETTNWMYDFALQGATQSRNLVAFADDKDQVATAIAALHQFELKNEEYENKLNREATTAQEKTLLQAIAAARGTYLPSRDQFLGLVVDGKLVEARDFLLKGLKAKHQAYLGSIFKLNGFYKTEMTHESQALQIAYEKTLKQLIVLPVAAILIACALAWWIARTIRKPLEQAVKTLYEIELGNYDTRITVESTDETGRVLAALANMQRRLKERTEADRAAAIKGGRIQQALDRVSAGVMLADNDGLIIYANDFTKSIFRKQAAEIRRHLPQFDPENIVGQSFDLFHRHPAHQRGMLEQLSGNHTAEIALGAAILKLSANPVLGAGGERIGTVVQWVDRSQEARTEEEIKVVVAQAIAGNLAARIDERGKEGFFKTLAAGMNQLGSNVAEIVRTMSRAAAEVSAGADEISRGNLHLSQRTEEQASSLEQTAASMEQMTSAVKNNADNAAQASQLAAAARDQAERGGKVVSAAVGAMADINAASKKIADIIGVVDEIAFQTNLLALNAAVEAARAGEQGRGFAVVASEVRNLASRSAQAAKEIKALIRDSVDKVGEGTRLVDESGRVLGDIVVGVKKVTDVVAEISASSREQSSGIDQVNRAIIAMDSVTQQNAALVEQAAAAAQALTEQASKLTEIIAHYHIGSEQPSVGSEQPSAAHTRAQNAA
jgi:methyl-accepting chemotaxis protein